MYYFFTILFVTFFFNIQSMDSPNALTHSTSSDESHSPRKIVFFDTLTSPQTTKNSRTKSLSPTPKNSYKNRVFARSADSSSPIRKSRSKTEPEIEQKYLQKPAAPKKNLLSRSPSPAREEDRPVPSVFIPSKPHKIDSFCIVKNKMFAFNEVYFFLSNHENNPNVQDDKTKQSLFHSAVLQKSEPLIDLFLSHPGLDSLIVNNDGMAAHQYIIGTDIIKHENLYKKLQLRATLDQIIYALLVTNEQFFSKTPLIDPSYDISALLLKIPKEIIPSYSTADFILRMVNFRLKHYMDQFEAIHKQYKQDLNYQDNFGNTLLHLLVILRNEKVIEKLVEDPKITFLKRNKENKLPQSLLGSTGSNVSKIRALLFMRDSIERWTLEAIEGELISNPLIDNLTLTKENDFVKNIIALVQKKSIQITQAQLTSDDSNQDRELPVLTSEIPAYATDEFFLQLIQYQLSHRKSSNKSIF